MRWMKKRWESNCWWIYRKKKCEKTDN